MQRINADAAWDLTSAETVAGGKWGGERGEGKKG